MLVVQHNSSTVTVTVGMGLVRLNSGVCAILEPDGNILETVAREKAVECINNRPHRQAPTLLLLLQVVSTQ